MALARFAIPVLVVLVATVAAGQVPKDGVLGIGGFRCVDLRPFKNDNYFDLYSTAFWSYGSFRMDIWKRHGVPFWYPQGAGNIRVAGAEWQPPVSHAIPGSANADAQQPGNGAIPFANDGDPDTYWYAGDSRHDGRLWIDFPHSYHVSSVKFLGWATGRHAPKDYAVGLILPDGKYKELANVKGEKRMGQWIEFPAGGNEAKGIYLDVFSTVEGEHGPVIYEFEAEGDAVPNAGPRFPQEVTVPLSGVKAKELFVLGNVGRGFSTELDVQTPVGEYVLTYEDGRTQTIPLIAGKNVADIRYGQFVPEAEFAWGLRDMRALMEDPPGTRYYHLDDFEAVDPKKQLMMFEHAVDRPVVPLKSLTFHCSDPKSWLVLEALTFRQDGPRMNALVYNGRQMRPYPPDTPKVKPKPVPGLCLDGTWEYVTDPGNRGMRMRYFEPGDGERWKTMPVPSQWYVLGLDYHGVVWFRREFAVPKTFPGQVLELNFDRVDYDARVWVNGQFVGRHKGAYSSFKFDVTKAVKRGEKNLLVVRVDSPIDPGFAGSKTIVKGNAMDDIAMPYAEEGCMGGIYRSVYLTGRGDVGIRNVWSETKLSPDLRRADVAIHVELTGGDAEVTARLGSVTAMRKASAGPVDIPLVVENPRLWYPWEQGKPNLYPLTIEVRRGGELLDRHVSRVGLREVSLNAQEKCITINHHRMFLKGMLNDDIHWQSMMDRTGYRQRIQLQKDANLNVIRLTTHQSSPDFYDLCDEMGMMVWQEMPLQWSYSSTEPVRRDILGIVAETVTQTRPHACVIGYSAWNEGGQFGFTDQITKLIRRLDPNRPMSRASGGGDWDVHVYPGQWWSLNRRSALWVGLTFGYVSETGAYGISNVQELKEMLGEDLFPFDSAEYCWETFTSYRRIDGTVFLDAPEQVEWTKKQMTDYVTSHAAASERWFTQSMKSMFENFQAQMFSPTTSGIYCRFDDPMPCAWLGVVTFDGKPRKCYWALKEACQQVLPILMLDWTGASDIRVVNEYWHRSFLRCTLHYTLTDRSGRVVTKLEKRFDLPADGVTKVATRDECGDIWHVPGGFFATLSVTDGHGKVLSENHYDMTGDEVRAFVTSVYPPAPTIPVDSVLVRAPDVTSDGARVSADGAYSPQLLTLGSGGTFSATVPADGEYLVRIACNSGAQARGYALLSDGKPVELESYSGLAMNQAITRDDFSNKGVGWFPGWHAHLPAGSHTLELKWRGANPPPVLLDAVCLQREK